MNGGAIVADLPLVLPPGYTRFNEQFKQSDFPTGDSCASQLEDGSHIFYHLDSKDFHSPSSWKS